MCIFVSSPLHLSIDVNFCFKSFTYVYRCNFLFQVLYICLSMCMFVSSSSQLSIDVGICLQSLTIVYRCRYLFTITYSCLSMWVLVSNSVQLSIDVSFGFKLCTVVYQYIFWYWKWYVISDWKYRHSIIQLFETKASNTDHAMLTTVLSSASTNISYQIIFNLGAAWRSGLNVWLVMWRSWVRASSRPPLFPWAGNITLIA